MQEYRTNMTKHLLNAETFINEAMKEITLKVADHPIQATETDIRNAKRLINISGRIHKLLTEFETS